MFVKYQLELNNNEFNRLSNIKFENIAKGRKGAILIDNNIIIPIVRTTTKYVNCSQLFLQSHYDIINQIKIITNKPNLCFNNALIEIYNNNYKNMGEHSDQSLDLSDDSYICLFSCYNVKETTNIRKLKIKNKDTNNIFEFELNHNSIILFSLETNSKHLHKIVLDNMNNNDNEWLGITFRLSKTFIKFINEIPYFNNTNIKLRLPTENELKEFYKYRSLENKLIEYKWSDIDYTISPHHFINLV